MKCWKKFLGALVLLMLVAVVVPLGGMKARALDISPGDGFYAKLEESDSHTAIPVGSEGDHTVTISVWDEDHPENSEVTRYLFAYDSTIREWTNEQIGPEDPYDPTKPNYSGRAVVKNVYINQDHDQLITWVNSDEAGTTNKIVLRPVLSPFGTTRGDSFTKYVSIDYDILDHNGNVVKSTQVSATVNFRKTIEKISLYNWLAPAGYTYGPYNDVPGHDVEGGAKYDANVLVRNENSYQTNSNGNPLSDTMIGSNSKIMWAPFSSSILSLTAGPVLSGVVEDYNQMQFTTGPNLGVEKIEAYPYVNHAGFAVGSYDDDEHSKGIAKVIVGQITPVATTENNGQTEGDKFVQTVYEGEYVDSPAVMNIGTMRTPQQEGLTYNWGIYNPDGATEAEKYTSATTDGTHIVLSSLGWNDDFELTQGNIYGALATDPGELIPVGATVVQPPSGHLGYTGPWNYPDKIRTVWYVRVLQNPPVSIAIPPRVVNKDGSSTDGRKTHSIETVYYKAENTEHVISESTKGVTHTGGSTVVTVNDTGKTVTGVSVGVSDLSAVTVNAPTVRNDATKVLVIRDLTLEVGEEGYLTADDLTALGANHTVSFALHNASDADKIDLVAATGHVTAKKPGVKIPVDVTITRTGTEYTDAQMTDTNVCYVTIPKYKINVSAGLIRYTGRKLQNDIPATLSNDAFSITGKDNAPVNDAALNQWLATSLSGATWSKGNGTSNNNAVTPGAGKLKPTAVGNDAVATTLTLDNEIYELNSSALTMNVDVYGYKFTGTTAYNWKRGSNNDLDYKIELVKPETQVVSTAPFGFKENEVIYASEFQKIEICPENKEDNVLLTLTKTGNDFDKYYHLEEGSVKITVMKDYLQTLANGTYVLIGYFKPQAENDNMVDTLNIAQFTIYDDIVPPPPPPPSDDPPPPSEGTPPPENPPKETPPVPGVSTGDVSYVGQVVQSLGVSLMYIGWYGFDRRKKKGLVVAASAAPDAALTDDPGKLAYAWDDDLEPSWDDDLASDGFDDILDDWD